MTTIRYAYYHLPTKKWVRLNPHQIGDVDLYLQDSLTEDVPYKSKEALTEDLLCAWYNSTQRYAEQNFAEFELKEIEVTMRLKQNVPDDEDMASFLLAEGVIFVSGHDTRLCIPLNDVHVPGADCIELKPKDIAPIFEAYKAKGCIGVLEYIMTE